MSHSFTGGTGFWHGQTEAGSSDPCTSRQISPFSLVSDIVSEYPEHAAVFEKWHIPPCCGDQALSVIQSCARSGVDYRAVIGDLLAGDAHSVLASGCMMQPADLAALSNQELVEHLLNVHYTYARHELPELVSLVNIVANAHGGEFPELWEVHGVIQQLQIQLFATMFRTEQTLFMWAQQCESQPRLGSNACSDPSCDPARWSASVVNGLRDDHEISRQYLQPIRELTQDFTPPPAACAVYRQLLQRLEAFSHDLIRQFAEEECELFPRVIRQGQVQEAQRRLRALLETEKWPA
jgi:regulator of cell morphogenesis and NO signaling